MSDERQLIYIHDPMCSWCWGFRPTLERMVAQLPVGIGLTRLLGGLAADTDRPMPLEMQARLQDTWRRIQQRIPGTRFNFDFWRDCKARRSTWPACRAVIAARSLAAELEDAMVLAIQHAYYIEARNPSDSETLIALAAQLGLDAAEFARRLDAPGTHAALDREMAYARRIGADSFPCLRLRLGSSHWPIAFDYTDATPMLDNIRALMED